MNNSDVTLVVLAGGEEPRMGRSKAALSVNGVLILEHVLNRIAWLGPTMLITAPGRERPPGAEHFTRECLDPVAGHGPLRGILTALENSPAPLVVVLAVDMPLVERRHVDDLIARTRVGRSLALIPARNVDGRRQIEPFPSIFHVDATDVIRARLARGERSVAGLTDEPRVATADVNWEPSAWLNLNHPTDLPLLAQHDLRIQ